MRSARALFAPALLLAVAACGSRTLDPFGTGTDASVTPPTELFACDGQGASCQLTPKTCCDSFCPTDDLSRRIAVAMNKNADYAQWICAQEWGDSGTGCAQPQGCMGGDPLSPVGNLQAVCRENRCVAIDVREDSFSACTTDADCALRYAECCECDPGLGHTMIALAKSQLSAYAQAICHPAADCAACPGGITYPTGVRAVCGAAGHCAVVTQ